MVEIGADLTGDGQKPEVHTERCNDSLCQGATAAVRACDRRLPYCGCVVPDRIVAYYSQNLSKHAVMLFDRCCGRTSMLKQPIAKIDNASRKRFRGYRFGSDHIPPSEIFNEVPGPGDVWSRNMCELTVTRASTVMVAKAYQGFVRDCC
jgi:hypothetical protein